MSAAFRTSLEFFQIGVVATGCSMAAAMFVELLFPRYDASRNPALQMLEGILGMTLHYMLGLELFLAAVPLTGRLYPATVFAVLTPVMVPNSLAKMSGNVRGLSEAVRPALPMNGGSVNPAPPPRPAPGTPDYDQLLQEIEERANEAVFALKQAVAAMPDLVTADQLAGELRTLQRDMERELAAMSGDLTRTGKAWAQHEQAQFTQKYEQRNAQWRQQLKQLKQDFAVQWAALKAQWALRPRCPGAPECEPVIPPVVPDVPTWDNPAEGVVLLANTYAYTGDPDACSKTLAGLTPQERDYYFDSKCGGQKTFLLTTNPATGTRDTLNGCRLPNIVRGGPVWGPLEDAYYPKTPECYTCTPPDPMAVNWIIDTGNCKTQKCGVLELRK